MNILLFFIGGVSTLLWMFRFQCISPSIVHILDFGIRMIVLLANGEISRITSIFTVCLFCSRPTDRGKKKIQKVWLPFSLISHLFLQFLDFYFVQLLYWLNFVFVWQIFVRFVFFLVRPSNLNWFMLCADLCFVELFSKEKKKKHWLLRVQLFIIFISKIIGFFM